MVGSLILPIVVMRGSTPVRAHLASGATMGYRVEWSEAVYDPGKSQPSKITKSALPVKIRVVGPNKLEVTSGPQEFGGRSAGRARVNFVSVDSGNARSGVGSTPFGVPLPIGGAAPGQSWNSSLASIPPLPAGMATIFTFVKAASGFALVKMTCTFSGACKAHGSGDLYLRLSDGVLDHGSCVIDVLYETRAGSNAATVSSRHRFTYTIRQ